MLRTAVCIFAVLFGSVIPVVACDLRLLLTWDVSPSMNANEYALQRQGTVEALSNPEVQNAIALLPGGVALSIMQWAGPGEQVVSIPWTMLHDGHDVASVALLVAALQDPFHERTGTAVGDSLRAARAHLDLAPLGCFRTVIDVSGDGASNAGIPTTPEAEALAAEGVIVNALVLPTKILQIQDDPFVFYISEVALSPGAFVMDVTSYKDYGRALRKKLLRELFIVANLID